MRSEVVDLGDQRAGNRNTHSGCGHQPVESARAAFEGLGDGSVSACGSRQVGDDLGVVEVDPDDPMTVVLEFSPRCGADTRGRPADRIRTHRTIFVSVRHTGQMDAAYRIDRLSADGRRLIDLVARRPLADVPACPGWTTTDLLDHVRRVWTKLAEHAHRLPSEPLPEADLPERTADEALEHLVAVLAETDPARGVWTWGTDRTAGFYLRRAHQETLVHRVDVEQALGERTPVPAADGVDGLDELFTVLVPDRGRVLPERSLHLHQTDGEGEFMLEVVDARLRVRREHAKGDAALRGTGEDLLLVMWGRSGLDGLEVFGDPAVVTEWARLSP